MFNNKIGLKSLHVLFSSSSLKVVSQISYIQCVYLEVLYKILILYMDLGMDHLAFAIQLYRKGHQEETNVKHTGVSSKMAHVIRP